MVVSNIVSSGEVSLATGPAGANNAFVNHGNVPIKGMDV